MSWFKREKRPLESVEDRRVVTEGLWIKCNGCKEALWKKDLEGQSAGMPEVQLSLQDFRIRAAHIIFDEGWQESIPRFTPRIR